MKAPSNARQALVHDDDATVVERMQRGEVGALGVLFDRHHRDVRRVVARLGVPLGDVDDVVQSAFLDALRAAASFDGRANAKPWLVGLAVMQVRRYRRSFARLAARAAAWAREPRRAPVTPEESATTRELASRTEAALGRLSDKKREVVVLVMIEGLSGEEAATLLGIPVATVWTRLHHARQELSDAVFEEKS